MGKKLSLFLADLAVLTGSLALTLLFRYGQGSFNNQFEIHIGPFAIVFAIFLTAFYIANLYESASLRNNIHFYSSLFQSIVLASGVSLVLFYLAPFFHVAPRTNFAIFAFILTGLEFGIRSLLNRVFERKFKRTILIIGSDDQSRELAQFVKENPQLGYELKENIELTPENLAKEKIEIAVVSPEAYQKPETINVLYKSLENQIAFFSLASFYERVTGKVPLGAINQVWFLENLSKGSKKGYETLKRIGDIAMALLIGAISLALFPFIALAIKSTSSGPVLYKQKRTGRVGKPFWIVKFRTMRQDAEKDGAVWAQEKDPRITKVGNFLRKSRLDELPQIWNILKGEMSFVGPRPERPEFQKELENKVPFYEERYLIKPGLTGWAQINFRYGSSVDDTAEKLKYDLYYIKNRSLLLDLGIILKTVRITLGQAGR